MSTLARRFREFGYLCICLSAALGLMMTFGYSAAVADRGTDVRVVNDENAFLGVIDNTELSTQSVSGTEEPLFFLDDNINVYDTSTTDDINATLEAFGDDGDPALAAEPLTDADHDWKLQLACGSETRNLTGTATVTVEMTGDVDVTLTRTTVEEVEANCNSK